MFKLDDKFLEELGLGALLKEQKKAFLQHVYNELESRVGVKLTEGMSDEKLDEFACFVDRNEAKMREWFAANLPDYASQSDFEKMQKSVPNASETELLSEYGAMKWLQKNQPDYPKVVAAALEELKTEISANKDAILGL
jgi:uncharacterized protein YdiU (UPF0061 family)